VAKIDIVLRYYSKLIIVYLARERTYLSVPEGVKLRERRLGGDVVSGEREAKC
jgi:hypothetical protein